MNRGSLGISTRPRNAVAMMITSQIGERSSKAPRHKQRMQHAFSIRSLAQRAITDNGDMPEPGQVRGARSEGYP
jgi:hypothetical protein